MDDLNHTYRLKEESVGPPKRYLGANVENEHMENGKECWSMRCVYYLQGGINNVDDILSKYHGACLK